MEAAIDIIGFIDRQLQVWETARNNYEALNGVEEKTFAAGNATLKVQFNPARIVSSAAKVDAKSLKERKCFLCEANRPDVQEGIEWGKYTILVNPFPIFPRHLTIPDRNHTDQRIAGRISDMMRLATVLDGFTLFYNGPKCGASAPDHMHFQAGNKGFMPVEADMKKADCHVVKQTDRSRLMIAEGLAQPFFLIETKEVADGSRLFEELLSVLDIPEGEPEPMLNVLCNCEDGHWNIAVFPRKKHRPDCYFAKGDDNLLISPASVDMGGVFITPLEKDFRKITVDDVLKIFAEVCLNAAELKEIAKRIK